MNIWLYDCMTVCLYDYMTTYLYDCMAKWLYDYMRAQALQELGMSLTKEEVKSIFNRFNINDEDNALDWEEFTGT